MEVICNDGTKDVSNGEVIPCLNHGGVKTQDKPSNTNKWLAIIGLTALAYFILYKSGSLK